MNILLMSLGTRGDIEPFISMAEMLHKEGHIINCLFPEQFKEEILELGYGFHGFDKAFLELINSQTGKSVMGDGGSFGQTIKNYLKLMKSSFKLQSQFIIKQKTAIEEVNADRVIFHPKCLLGYIEAMKNPDQFILMSPIPCINHPSDEHPHIGLSKWGTFSSKWNLRSYKLINGIRYYMTKKMTRKYVTGVPKIDFSLKKLKDFEEKELKTIYPISKFLYPKPKYWPESARISGYITRDQSKDYTPSEELIKWLSNYPKAILVTFGSMSNTSPKKHSKTIVRLCEKLGIPVLINTSWGGLEEIENSSDSTFYVKYIPYDWILPKLYGVIHHGGSGTTHYSALHGCVQLIIPHIIDQYFWNKIIEERGSGPLGIPIHKLDTTNLEPILLDFWTNSNYKIKANDISKNMKKEVDKSKILEFVL